jgi:Helix-turn-helix domain
VGEERITLDDSILAMRLRVMRRAHELNSVTVACQEAGISRTLFYRWRKRFERYGHAARGRPRQIGPAIEQLVLGVALAWPTWGCRRVAAHLGRTLAHRMAANRVQGSSAERDCRAAAIAWRCSSMTAPGPVGC